MSYTDDAVLAKLNTLHDTQEAIVTTGQWIMFHRRHAAKTAELWLRRLKETTGNRRLVLIYLLNEVAQQSKARKKDDFLIAFSPIVVEGTEIAYKAATSDVKTKIRRVVMVWRERGIWDPQIQAVIEARLDDLDKNRSNQSSLLGGSLTSTISAPRDLQPLVPLQNAVNDKNIPVSNTVAYANAEYAKLTNPDTPTPSPPVHAARLSSLLKTLANAEGAVTEAVKVRKALVDALEKLLDTNKAALAEAESQKTDFANKRALIDEQKREVEDGIMRGLAEAEGSPSRGASGSPGDKKSASPIDEPRAFRSPSVESLTPPPETKPEPVVIPEPQQVQQPIPTPGADLLSSFAMPRARQFSGSPSTNGSASKKRKMSHSEDIPADSVDAMEGLDDDVAEMLRRDSGGF